MSQTAKGLVLAVAAFLVWGVSPFYFKALMQASPYEIIAHRVIWSALFLSLLLRFIHKDFLQTAFKQIRSHGWLLGLAATLLSLNWLVFIYSITHQRVLEASLGYFINPLFNVALAFVFLKEKLSTMQKFAVLLASMGVLQEIFRFGQVPYLALSLAVSFGTYGLIRKKADVGGSEGLFVETLILLPLAIGYLVYLNTQQQLAFLHKHLQLDILLVLAGVVTLLPLIWYIGASKKLTYSTLGLLQYIAPSIMGFLGFWIYHEQFPEGRLLTFTLIWTGLLGIMMEQLFRKRA